MDRGSDMIRVKVRSSPSSMNLSLSINVQCGYSEVNHSTSLQPMYLLMGGGGGGRVVVVVLPLPSFHHRNDASFTIPNPYHPTPSSIFNPPPPTRGKFITFLWTVLFSSMIPPLKVSSLGCNLRDMSWLGVLVYLTGDRFGSWAGARGLSTTKFPDVSFNMTTKGSKEEGGGGRYDRQLCCHFHFAIVIIVLVVHHTPEAINGTPESIKSFHLTNP